MKHPLADEDGVIHSSPINEHFALSYASYFCMPRSALQALPLDWQRRLVVLMQEANALGLRTPDDYEVRRRDPHTGMYLQDAWLDYRHPDQSLLPESLRAPIL